MFETFQREMQHEKPAVILSEIPRAKPPFFNFLPQNWETNS